jgi:DNA-binding NtrC family response regulator
LKHIAGELEIALPPNLEPPKSTGSSPFDYANLVQKLDAFIRQALFGHRAASTGNAAPKVEPAEYQRLLRIKNEIDPEDTYIGKSVRILKIFDIIKVANSIDKIITILGPSGSGKTQLAELIHKSSKRKGKKFERHSASETIASDSSLPRQNWTGIGAESGVSNAPPKGRQGTFQECEGGTIFLDEVHELHLDFQLLLLDIIDKKPTQRVTRGADSFVPNVRLLLASNRVLDEEVTTGRFSDCPISGFTQPHGDGTRDPWLLAQAG